MENNHIEIDNEIRNYFNELLLKSEISVDEEKKEKMLGFLELLHEKNKVMNLTAIRDKKGMAEKHFIDSLFLAEIIKEEEQKIIDVGTGAGFPGLALAIYYPEKEFLLVDSVRKKIEFINEVIEKLKLENVTALCRGVANLRIILEYMIPFLKVNGRFLPQKLNLNELEESGNALKKLNASVENIHKFHLPESGDERIILEIRKLKKTDGKYPRKTGIPAKKPL